MIYFHIVKQDESKLLEALKYFEEEYNGAKGEVKIDGKLTTNIATLSSNFDKRYEQMNELDAIKRHFEIKLSQKKSELYKKFLENYQRQLSSNDIKIYIDGQPEIVALQQILNEITLVYNKFIGLTKGFDIANYQLSNLSRLYSAGVENITI